jgi:hypothetical protein
MGAPGQPAAASFPTSIWDGSSNSRVATTLEPVAAIYRDPDGDDFNQLAAEVIALENRLKALHGALNTAALATTATAGHFKMPTCAGTPTGVPADGVTGFASAVYDTTAHKIWVYDAGWKATAALA